MKNNMCLWDDNSKMEIKENCFLLTLNYSLQKWAKLGFWKS
jgi:hypothetical protein